MRLEHELAEVREVAAARASRAGQDAFVLAGDVAGALIDAVGHLGLAGDEHLRGGVAQGLDAEGAGGRLAIVAALVVFAGDERVLHAGLGEDEADVIGEGDVAHLEGAAIDEGGVPAWPMSEAIWSSRPQRTPTKSCSAIWENFAIWSGVELAAEGLEEEKHGRVLERGAAAQARAHGQGAGDLGVEAADRQVVAAELIDHAEGVAGPVGDIFRGELVERVSRVSPISREWRLSCDRSRRGR